MKRNLLAIYFFTAACASLWAGDFNTAPVPEPGSIILLGTAAVGIGYAVWRRGRKK